jgi:hypothetical protein
LNAMHVWQSCVMQCVSGHPPPHTFPPILRTHVSRKNTAEKTMERSRMLPGRENESKQTSGALCKSLQVVRAHTQKKRTVVQHMARALKFGSAARTCHVPAARV